MTNEAKAIKEDYQWQVKSQWGLKPIKNNLKVIMKLYFKDERKHDIDNYGKLVLDSLNGIFWEDDSQINELKIIKNIDKKNPRVEIII